MNNSTPIYLDYAATTPVDPRVLDVMLPCFTENFGNPSSVHAYGQNAENALENARESVARSLNCRTDEIVFTSCGTESDNLALRGAAIQARETRGANHILISPVEHHAVSHTARQLADHFGFDVEFLPVDDSGMVDPEDVRRRIRPTTALVSIIYANNEIGTVNPIAEIGAVCREMSVLFHTDAVQAAAHLPIDLERENIDLMAIGAHKFYGPKGVGALYVRKGVKVLPGQTGGGQENRLRAGTQNVPYIVGMAEALRLVREESDDRRATVVPLRDRIIGRVLEEVPQAKLTGHSTRRLPNHASFVFEGANGNTLLMLLDAAGFACSSGSACKTGSPEPSEVLTAIGLPRSWALGSLRVTLSHLSKPQEIDLFIDVLPKLVEQVRTLG